MDTDVLIVGAGPVGLTLAVDLGRRGVRCTLVEQKSAPHMWPKMERCNARSMEIYRRLGLAEKIRAAGLPAWVPMDVFIVTSLVEPPLLHLPYPSVDAGQAGDRRRARRHAAARAVSAHLAIHARAAAEVGRGDAAERHGALRLRVPVVRAGRQFGDRRGERGRQDLARSPRSTWSAATAAPAPSASSSTSSSPAKATSCSFARRCTAATSCSSASPSARAATTTSPTTRRRSSSCRTRPGTSRCIRWSRRTRTWRRCSRRPSPCRCKYEMLYVGEWRQNLLVADRFMDRPGAARRRRRASDDPDRRARHEHRRRRRHRSRLEARRHAARLGRAGAARVLRGRAAADRRAQRRRLALRLAGPAQVARAMEAEHPRRYAGGRRGPRQSRRGRRRRAAQDQRDDRRRARLPLRRLAARSPPSRASRPTISSTTRRARFPACGCRMPGSTTAAPCRTASATATRCSASAAAKADVSALAARFGRSARRSPTLDLAGQAARDVYGYDSSWCGPTCTWSGAATRRRSNPATARGHGHRPSR